MKKYFGTDGIRGKVGTFPITPEFILKLGWAVGRVFSSPGKRTRIIVGKDTRISGYMFESALEAGLTAAGANIKLLGPMPTPAVAYLTQALRANAGIVISASHNPYYDNGIKFFSPEGFKLSDEIELAIEAEMDKPMEVVSSDHLGKAVRLDDAPGRYIEFCKSKINREVNLKGLKIIIDCANGAGYYVAPCVFRELGAEVVELAVDPDGKNINEFCGATNLTMLQRIVTAEKADLGIALDGDADRIMMVDHKGEAIDGDELLFIIAKHAKAQGQAVQGVVGTQMSNLGLEIALKKNDIDFVRAQVGDRYVMAELKSRGWQMGGESSGHIVCLDLTTTGDAIISALQVLQAMFYRGVSLHELKQDMQKYPQVLINVPVSDQKQVHDNPKILASVNSIEKTLAKKGRVLLRPSGTEPLVRVMVEGEDADLIQSSAEQLAAVVRDSLS
jgi:phosphoglucosamine mutase